MTGQKPAPGRYAQHPDGTWVPFKDKAALLFKPVAVVTVKAPVEKPVFKPGISRAPGSAANPAPDPSRAAIITVAKPGGGHVGMVTGGTEAAIDAMARSVRVKAAQSRRSPAAPDAGAQAKRTAAPADVFRAIADEFGILPAVGAHKSTARFKPMARRNEDDDAASAYARAVQEGTGKA